MQKVKETKRYSQSNLADKFVKKDKKYPDEYPIIDEIKSPLNILWYNLNFHFKDKYPAKMPEDFARDMIKMYSKEDDLVFDPMCGSGIVPRMANQLNRLGVGMDINPKAIELAKKHDKNNTKGYIISDALNFDPQLKKPKLILFSPPFGLNIIGDKNQYSDEQNDVSRCKTYDKFYENMDKVFQNCYDLLEGGGIMIIDSRDRTKEGVYQPLIFKFWELIKNIGFEVICRYTYMMIPYRQMTYKHRESREIMPMVTAMDALVCYKPMNESLDFK